MIVIMKLIGVWIEQRNRHVQRFTLQHIRKIDYSVIRRQSWCLKIIGHGAVEDRALSTIKHSRQKALSTIKHSRQYSVHKAWKSDHELRVLRKGQNTSNQALKNQRLNECAGLLVLKILGCRAFEQHFHYIGFRFCNVSVRLFVFRAFTIIQNLR